MGGQLSEIPKLHITITTNLPPQLVYAVLTELPAVYILYDSSFWSGTFLIILFSVSVWNGGGFYIEVFGRKSVIPTHPGDPWHLTSIIIRRFEHELEAMRKELADTSARSGSSTPNGLGILRRGASEDELSSMGSSPVIVNVGLPPITTPLELSPETTPVLESKKDH